MSVEALASPLAYLLQPQVVAFIIAGNVDGISRSSTYIEALGYVLSSEYHLASECAPAPSNARPLTRSPLRPPLFQWATHGARTGRQSLSPSSPSPSSR